MIYSNIFAFCTIDMCFTVCVVISIVCCLLCSVHCVHILGTPSEISFTKEQQQHPEKASFFTSAALAICWSS